MSDPIRSHRPLTRRLSCLALSLVLIAGPASAADTLADLSLEDLMNVTVTSATKREQSKNDAAAAITVLTSEEIRRSGATSIPEVLRLVPGLNVARIDSSRWAISARGYNDQFANKLLVLIDGRVVYTPLFGGVYWDVQDTVLADVERIEVIRGPGGTLWGANAVNGVINITTKSAKDTEGVHAMGLAGNQEYVGEGRFGGSVGDRTSYRVYGKGFKRDQHVFPDDATRPYGSDEWWQWRVGARVDSQLTDDDLVTIDGAFYDGENDTAAGQLTAADTSDVRGGHVLTRWTRTLSARQNVEVQAYWDQTQRDWAQVEETRNNVDVQAQHAFGFDAAGEWLINWGAEYWWSGDELLSAGLLEFDPSTEDFHRVSGFLQAQWNLFGGDLQLIAGTKLEWNNWTDFEYQPTGRALWKFVDGNAVWASVSRAVRAPTRVDRDIVIQILPLAPPVTGNKDIESEDLLAFEFGYRNYMAENVSFDLSLFYNDYDDFVGLTGLTFGNAIDSRAWGGEAELAWQATEGLRFITSYGYLQVEDDTNGAGQVFGTNDGSAPQHTWMLRGLWSLPWAPVELDSTVWYVSKLTARYDPAFYSAPFDPVNDPIVGSYWRLDLRTAWQARDWLGLEFVAQNVTEEKHPEFGVSSDLQLFPGNYVPRSYYGKVTLTF